MRIKDMKHLEKLNINDLNRALGAEIMAIEIGKTARTEDWNYFEIPPGTFFNAFILKNKPEKTTKRFVRVSAGSGYGTRTAWYEMVSCYLSLLHSGDHDNLGGNDHVLDFENLTLDEVQRKVQVLNERPKGHAFDGCHTCYWSIEVAEEEPPDWLIDKEPEYDFWGRILRQIEAMRGEDFESESFQRFMEKVNSLASEDSEARKLRKTRRRF